MNTTPKYGFIEPAIRPEEYVFGSQLGSRTIEPSGQWDAYLPEYEAQHQNGLETSNCTVYGSLNCIEILMKRQFGFDKNFSERFIGVLAETTPIGNQPHKVLDVIRKNGLIDDKLLPFDEEIDEWDDYYSPKPMTRGYLKEGLKFLEQYSISHDWVFVWAQKADKVALLKKALQSSPIGISVAAWFKNDDGLYYKPDGVIDNHWCTLYGYEDGKYWKIFDHYDDSRKRLVWDYDFGFAKRVVVDKITHRDNWLVSFIKSLKQFIWQVIFG